MAIKKVQIIPPGYTDIVHPETSASQVLVSDGKTVEDKVKDLGGYSVASGTNTYATTVAGIASLAEGLSIKIKFTNANTGASSLNINTLGAVNIMKSNGSALKSGNIKAGQIYNLVYTGSVFQLLGESTDLSSLGITATATELNYVDGVTSAIQTQLNGKSATTHTHTKANITDFPASLPANGGNADTVGGYHVGNRTNWANGSAISAVVGQLAWKYHSNGGTIFDASNGITPSGTACNNTTPDVGWVSNFPILMGWNGSNTYGVKVNRADYSDSSGYATGAGLADTIDGKHVWVGAEGSKGTDANTIYFCY